MEDKNNIKELNIAASIPEDNFQRDENGKIIIDNISLGKSKRNNDIVPDDIFDKYYRELPDKVENQSGSWRTTASNGKIKILGGDPEGDKAIHKAGAEALNATKAQRRTCREILEEIAKRPANSETIDRLGLKEGTSNLEALNYAQYMKAQQGDTKAAEFVRDTIGEKPVNEIAATIETTPEDMELVKRAAARLESGNIE